MHGSVDVEVLLLRHPNQSSTLLHTLQFGGSNSWIPSVVHVVTETGVKIPLNPKVQDPPPPHTRWLSFFLILELSCDSTLRLNELNELVLSYEAVRLTQRAGGWGG